MQKAGVPEGAIRQKMMSAGIDPEPMFGGCGIGSGGSGPRGPPPPAISIKARGPPPLSTKEAATPKKSSGPPAGMSGGLLAAIQKGKMLKKTETKEPASAPAAPANPMMAAVSVIVFLFFCFFCFFVFFLAADPDLFFSSSFSFLSSL